MAWGGADQGVGELVEVKVDESGGGAVVGVMGDCSRSLWEKEKILEWILG